MKKIHAIHHGADGNAWIFKTAEPADRFEFRNILSEWISRYRDVNFALEYLNCDVLFWIIYNPTRGAIKEKDLSKHVWNMVQIIGDDTLLGLKLAEMSFYKTVGDLIGEKGARGGIPRILQGNLAVYKEMLDNNPQACYWSIETLAKRVIKTKEKMKELKEGFTSVEHSNTIWLDKICSRNRYYKDGGKDLVFDILPWFFYPTERNEN